MAKRKAAGTTRRKAARKSSAANRKRAPARKTAGRKAGAKKAARRAKTVRKKSKTAATARASRRKPVRKAVGGRSARSVGTVTARRAPALDRARRTVQGDDIVPTPPSSLNMDRSASAARSGRREMRERLDQHTETSPALTAGDVDADWEGAYSSGDEAPGGDNPTPDQDVVDDIGKAVGVQYEDNEELKGEAKITKRDKHRWELDPASSEDYKDR
jgi:hypothetical protein